MLHEAGYVYDSSFAADDVPYLIGIAPDRSEELAELPWAWSLDERRSIAD